MNTLLRQGVPKFVYPFFYEGEEYECKAWVKINEKNVFQMKVWISRIFYVLNITDIRVHLLQTEIFSSESNLNYASDSTGSAIIL